MVIVQDTREQLELDWSGIEGIEKVEVIGLPYGDYTAIVHGKPVPIYWERKSLNDLFGTMTSGYERFKKEMSRAKEANVELILCIEGTYTDVWDGVEYSQFPGPSMIQKLETLWAKYGLWTVFCESRRVMARTIAGKFSAVERNFVV